MALTDKLTAIGNAIRTKTGGTDLLTLDQMPTEISNIQGGGTVEELTITSNGTYNPPTGIDGFAPVVVNVPQDGSPPESAFNITGDCKNKFSGGGWDWFIEMYGNKITTRKITNGENMFYGSQVSSIPFEINMCWDATPRFYQMFSESNITSAPKINITDTTSYYLLPNYSWMFAYCQYLRNIDYDYFNSMFSDEQWQEIHGNNSGNRSDTLFYYCKSLRKHPDISRLYDSNTYGAKSIYSNTFYGCYTLDEITNMPVISTMTYTENIFYQTFYDCLRLKNLIFETNNNGTPKTVNWSNQTIDLGNRAVGYSSAMNYKSDITGYNTGITADKEVYDNATYQALKDDPDWFSMNINYSRYNHDSAVRTINSLPDTSAYLTANGGTNTIIFKGASGASTDGGAINTLTEEEIAVATAKGWTVSLS